MQLPLIKIFSMYNPHSKSGIRDFCDELSNSSCIVSQLVNKLIRINSPIIDNSLNLHGYIILCDDLLWCHVEDRCLHVNVNHALTDGVYQMEAGLEYF